jgi:hypothetical protein
MPIAPGCQGLLDEFLGLAEALKEGYLNSSCCYVAVKLEDRFVLRHAKVFYSPLAVAPLSHVETENVRAGSFRIDEPDPQKLISDLLAGRLTTHNGEMLFPPADNGSHGAMYMPFHQDGILVQRRVTVLRLFGKQLPQLQQPALDWELKACDTPFDSIQELMNEYILGQLVDGPISVDLVVRAVVEIDGASTIRGDKADFRIVASKGIDPKNVKLGYRVTHENRIVTRTVIDNGRITWSNRDDDLLSGEVTIDVPPASIVNAVASYKGMAQHYWWFGDPSASQNPRRAIYETFDPGMGVLKDILAKAQGRGQEARQFESAVAWLLWMYGFAPAHFGGTPRTQDAADLVATTPSGHVCVVECTTGLLKAENKLALLYQRTEAVRQSLKACNQLHLRVLPVIVTSRSREEAKPDIEQAERLGILVMTKDEFEQALLRTLAFPSADRMYEQAEASIRDARAKHEDQQGGEVFQIPG